MLTDTKHRELLFDDGTTNKFYKKVARDNCVYTSQRIGNTMIIEEERLIEDDKNISALPLHATKRIFTRREVDARINFNDLLIYCVEEIASERDSRCSRIYDDEYYYHILDPAHPKCRQDRANSLIRQSSIPANAAAPTTQYCQVKVDDKYSFGSYTRQQRFNHYRKNGASKQVAAEMVAQQEATLIAEIVEAYETVIFYDISGCVIIDGWFTDYSVDEFDIHKADIDEIKHDVACDLAQMMVDDGWIIQDIPDQRKRMAGFRKQRLKNKLNSFNWKK